MTFEIGLVLAILAVAVVLFASEKIRVDVVALLVMLSLLFTDTLTVDEAFSGFANPAVITVWAIYIVSASLTHTGIADYIGSYMGRVAGTSERRLILVIMVVVAGMSAFMNNIGAAAVLLPVVITLGREADVPVSKLLMPMAFGSLLGGVTTLIGTPPNLLANDALREAGLPGFSLFDFTPMGLIILASSIVYMLFIGRHLLPEYENVTHHRRRKDLTEEYQLQTLLTQLRVLASGAVIGKTLVETRLGNRFDVDILGVQRNGRLRLGGVLPNAHLRADDILLVKGEPEPIAQLQAKLGLQRKESVLSAADITSSEVGIAEVVISQKAKFIGQTLREIDFRGRFGLTVLAIWREEAPILTHLADVALRLGDTLLVQGRHERLEAVLEEDALLLLNKHLPKPARLHKAPLNLLIFVSMITFVALEWLHISEAAVLGAVLTVLSGCLSMDEAYQSIEWKSVFLIAGMLPMGVAMEKTGAAQFLADQIIGIFGGGSPTAVLIGLFILTTVLTAFMSNAAAAVLVAPIAIQSAATLGIAPYAFVMGVAMAASNSFVTPIGHQSCVLVYGPGGYRFFDFARVGLPLTILLWILMAIFLPVFWPY